MSTISHVSSEKQATAREQPFNEFLFKILKSFDFAEFKKFTNFPQLLEETIKWIMGSDADLCTLDDRIRYHFETNLSNIDKWNRGLFNQVELTTEFYGSDAAKRIFEDAYGIKECVVRLVLPTESRNFADFEEWLHELTSSAIFKTEDFHNPIIGLTPLTTFKDGTIQRQPDRSLHLLRYNVFRQPKIGPKSRTRHRFFMSSSEEESSDGSVLNYSFTELDPDVQSRHRFLMSFSSEESSDDSVLNNSFTKPDVQLLNNVFATPKPKIDPKSRISHTIDNPVLKLKMESKFQMNSANAPAGDCVNSSYKTLKASLQRFQINAKSTECMDTTQIPSRSCPMQKIHENTLSAECIGIKSSEAPAQYSDAIELSNNIIRSVKRAQLHLTKYFAEKDRNVQSIKHFWNDFFRSEFEEVETLNGMKIEPHASVVDPHPVRYAEHSDVQLETKTKVELVEYNNNETYSSDVQIIELPTEEPIEISDDG